MKQPKIKLLNPLKDDFSITRYVDGSPILFTIKAGKTASFPEDIGQHVKHHLIETILNLRGIRKYQSWENGRIEVEKEIVK